MRGLISFGAGQANRYSLNCSLHSSASSHRYSSLHTRADPGHLKGPLLLCGIEAGVSRLQVEALATANLPEK